MVFSHACGIVPYCSEADMYGSLIDCATIIL